MPCLGNTDKHCCYIRQDDGTYKECPFVISNHTDEQGYFRRWACGLRAELGDWDKVLADPRYPRDSWAPGVNCRDWPDNPPEWRGCNICGAGK